MSRPDAHLLIMIKVAMDDLHCYIVGREAILDSESRIDLLEDWFEILYNQVGQVGKDFIVEEIERELYKMPIWDSDLESYTCEQIKSYFAENFSNNEAVIHFGELVVYTFKYHKTTIKTTLN